MAQTFRTKKDLFFRFQLFTESVIFFFRLHGIKGGVRFAIGLMRSGYEFIYVSDLKKSDIQHLACNPELDVIFIKTLAEYDQIAWDYSAARGRELSKQDRNLLTSNRDYLAAVYHKSEFVGWGWIKKGPLKYGNSELGPKDCVIHKCRTLAHHRKKGVYTTLLAQIQKEMVMQGTQRAFIGAKSFNTASIKGIEKNGFGLVEKCYLGSFWSRVYSHLRKKGSKVLKYSNSA